MADLILEPYAGHLHWQMRPTAGEHPWERVLADHLEELARRCDQHEQCLIGHIKGLATFPDGGHLRVNVISPDRPADVAGAAPEGCSQLTFTLNVLVYGLSRETLSRLVQDTAGQVAETWGGTVLVDTAGGNEHQSHSHD